MSACLHLLLLLLAHTPLLADRNSAAVVVVVAGIAVLTLVVGVECMCIPAAVEAGKDSCGRSSSSCV